MTHALSEDEALLILGSLFWNTFSREDNRYHDRSEIHPVQLVIGSEIVKAPYFDHWGELGVSSMAHHPDGRLYFTTGADLIEVSPGAGPPITTFEIPGLRDVHEITLLGDLLWLANTGHDEVVAFDVHRREVARRIPLEPFRSRVGMLSSRREGRDRFHCNQVFQGLDGRLYGLVHQVTGRMLGKRVARHLLRKRGDGGVIDLEAGSRKHLWLVAPHTVTVVNGEYWIFDSGSRHINIYDARWRLKARIPVPSFGRGAAMSRSSGLFFAGMSQWKLEKSDRVSAISRGALDERNLIQVFQPEARQCVGEIPVPDGVEQINNVYILPRKVAGELIQFS